MKERALVAPKGTFPGMAVLLHESVPAALAQKKSEFFVDSLFQLPGVRFLNFVENLSQLAIDSLLRFNKHSVKIGKNPDVDHVGQVPRGKLLAAP